MRYFLHKEKELEIRARREYLEQTFHFWFVEREQIDSFIVLESFPSTAEKETCIIYGHNFEVADLLKNHSICIPEKNIFIIACLTKNKRDFILFGKRTYIAPQKTNEGIKLRYGREFGFKFDISDVELNLFNSKTESIYDKLRLAFDRIY